MSYKLSKTSLYVKDPISGELVPVGVVSSGADESLQAIKTYAEDQKAAFDEAVDDKAAKTIATIPEEYTELFEEVGTKVDKVDGKGLSTNDYTTEEKSKLSGIEEGANKITVDSELSETSENPVQNKVVKAAIDAKVDKVDGKALSTNDYTTDEKTKLAGIEEGANKITVDSELSESSENPVQNKAVTEKITEIKSELSQCLYIDTDGYICLKEAL